MDSPTAEILAIDGQRARVRVDDLAGCALCAAGKGCGAGLLRGERAARELWLELPRTGHFAQGDQVQLALPPERLLQATAYAYGLPLLALTLVPLAANTLWGPLRDTVLASLALLGVAAAIVLGRHLLAQKRCLQQFVPMIARTANSGDS